jgi:hypothetical protein
MSRSCYAQSLKTQRRIKASRRHRQLLVSVNTHHNRGFRRLEKME